VLWSEFHTSEKISFVVRLLKPNHQDYGGSIVYFSNNGTEGSYPRRLFFIIRAFIIRAGFEFDF
jgi:hypothetical protein